MSEETFESFSEFIAKLCFQLKKGNIMAKGTFNITLIVDTAPIQMAANDDLGPVNVPLPVPDALPITGGTPPYTVSNVQGTVPPGVTINSDGTVTGTPTEAGSFPLSISLQDSLG
jgi:hypothetical protein